MTNPNNPGASKPDGGIRERLSVLVAQHWPILDCNEETHQDRTTCSCALHGATWQPTVGQAIKEWADHLAEQLFPTGLFHGDQTFDWIEDWKKHIRSLIPADISAKAKEREESDPAVRELGADYILEGRRTITAEEHDAKIRREAYLEFYEPLRYANSLILDIQAWAESLPDNIDIPPELKTLGGHLLGCTITAETGANEADGGGK